MVRADSGGILMGHRNSKKIKNFRAVRPTPWRGGCIFTVGGPERDSVVWAYGLFPYRAEKTFRSAWNSF